MSSRRRRRRKTSTTFMNLFIYVSLSINFLFTSPIKVDCKMKNWNFSFPQKLSGGCPNSPSFSVSNYKQRKFHENCLSDFFHFQPDFRIFLRFAKPTLFLFMVWAKGILERSKWEKSYSGTTKIQCFKTSIHRSLRCPRKIFKFEKLTIIVAPKNRKCSESGGEKERVP